MKPRASVLACAVALALMGTAFGQLQPEDVARAAEVERLLATHAHDVWPGWGPQALLIRAGEREYLVGHPSPPEGFAPFLDAPAEIAVHVLEGHLTPAPIATSWPVGEVWSVAIPVLAEFQTAIDEALGVGVVVLDDPSYIRAVIHEAFHAFQLGTYGGPDALPRADASVDERAVFAQLQRVGTLDAWHARQGRALARALRATTEAERIEAAAEFLRARERWRREAPQDARALERQVEWTEGLARYADTALMMSRDRDGREQEARLEPYPSADRIWTGFLAELEDPTTIPGGLRDRYYVLGAAQGFILDELLPDWKGRALPGGEALEDLVAEAVERYGVPDRGPPDESGGVRSHGSAPRRRSHPAGPPLRT